MTVNRMEFLTVLHGSAGRDETELRGETSAGGECMLWVTYQGTTFVSNLQGDLGPFGSQKTSFGPVRCRHEDIVRLYNCLSSWEENGGAFVWDTGGKADNGRVSLVLGGEHGFVATPGQMGVRFSFTGPRSFATTWSYLVDATCLDLALNKLRTSGMG